jgi:hypothetical protein
MWKSTNSGGNDHKVRVQERRDRKVPSAASD